MFSRLGWFPTHETPLPPRVTSIPRTLEYLRTYYQEWSYIMPQQMGELENTYKRRLYDIFRVLTDKKSVARSVRIINMFPSISWHLLWRNLPQAVVKGAVPFLWCMSIHDLVPPNVRLHCIRIMASDSSSQCGAPDTLLHRLRSVEPA
jgi:hypothetical protein